jgi:hypothetical protein
VPRSTQVNDDPRWQEFFQVRIGTRWIGGIAGAAVAVATLAVGGSHATLAAEGGLEGSWQGGGRVVLPSGNSERVRCRATFRRQSATSYAMSAVCATPSARVAQQGQVQRVSGNAYAGRFYNPEYDASGTVRITVRGNRLTASLAGGGGSGQLAMTR